MLLLISAAAKVQPASAALTPLLVTPGSPTALMVAFAELVLACGLLVCRTRTAAAITASMFIVSGAGYAAISVMSGLPACGCFGHWVVVAPWMHVLIAGIALCLLAAVGQP